MVLAAFVIVGLWVALLLVTLAFLEYLKRYVDRDYTETTDRRFPS